jgi:poly-beta-1,6-N-acetyl-D-glucosamine N-deacetylase PgaB
MEEPDASDGYLWFVGISGRFATEQQAREDARRNALSTVVQYTGTLVKDKFERARTSYGLDSNVVDPTSAAREFEKQMSVNMANKVKVKNWYQEKWQMAGDLAALRGDPIMKKRWTQAKTQALVNWTNALAERVRTWRPTIKTARNLFAETILDPTSEAWSAQTLDETLAHIDYAVLRAMPNLKQTSDAVTWLGTLVERVKRHPGALAKTIFELQVVDGRHGNRAIPSATLADQMLLLQRLGAVNFGYYPDNFIANQPDANELHRVMSLQTYPYRP